MYNSSYNNYNSGGRGAGVFVAVIIAIIIGSIVAAFNSGGSSSGSYDYYDDYSSDYYDVPSYVEYPEPDYDDYDYSYEEPEVEEWECMDTASYDKNPYNDNYCVSTYGREMYTTDSNAESLDPYYTAGTSGHPYYNSF